MSDSSSPIVGAIDIGSNSFQITIARISEGQIEIIERAKETVRLAAVVDRSHFIPTEVIDRACVILSHFRDLALKHDAELRVSATAALRNTRNADEFVNQARDVALVDVCVIDAMTEARLIRTGIKFGMPAAFEQPVLCIDVGGGSTEFSVSTGDHIQMLASVPLGAVNVSSRYLGEDPVSGREVNDTLGHLRRELLRVARMIQCLPRSLTIATGGSIQRLARLVAAGQGAARTDVDGFKIGTDDLARCTRQLRDARTQTERLKMPGMDPDRADVLLGGALIFKTLGEILGIKEWTVSMNALRAGLISSRDWPPA